MSRGAWGLSVWRLALTMSIALLSGVVDAHQDPSGEATSPGPAPEALASEQRTAGAAHEDQPGGEEPEGAVRVSMEFQNALLKDVLKAFSQQTGLNVVAEAAIGEKAITLYLEDVAPLDALEQILRTYNLTYERPVGSDIYIVKAATATAGPSVPRTITRLYHLKYARVSKSVLAKAAAAFGARTPFEGSSLGTTGTTSGGGGGGSSSSSGGGSISSYSSTTASSTTAGSGGAGAAGGGADSVGLDVVLKTLLTTDGSVIVDERTNSLLVTDVVDNFPRLEGALTALDVRTPQILVEVEILETTLSKVKDLGIEWGTTGNLATFTPGSRKTRFPFGWLPDSEAPTHTSADQFSLSTLDASSSKGVLQALETDTDTKILARPKVLTLDNESAVIRLSADEAVGFKTTTGGLTATTVSAEPERQTTGVILVVTPQTNADGYITMLVEPSVTKTVASKISPPSGQATPRDAKTRSTRTLIRLRSGDTFVVGGLIDRSEEESMKRVPLLSSIPLLGEVFKNRETNNSTSELIVFVTPRLLEEPAVTHVASAPRAWPSELREQEPAGGQPSTLNDAMEQALDALE